MTIDPFLQNGLQTHSNSTFNINTSEGVCSHFVETNRWGAHTHFVVGTHFMLQNGVHNPIWSIGRGMQNADLFSCRVKVSTELGISPAGCFSLQIAKRHILGFRLKKKANGNPMYAWIYFRKHILTCTNLNCQSAIGEQRRCYRLVGCIYKRGPPICAFACERSTVFGRFGSPEQEILHGP